MSPRKPQPFSTVGGKKPDLIVHGAEFPATARALGHLLANEAEPRIFARIDGTPVFVLRIADGGAELRTLTRDHLINFAHDICQPIKWTEEGRAEITLPDRVAELALAVLTSEQLLPVITGTTTGPILRANSEICCAPGFDAATGLFVCDAPTLTLPERPTKEDAKEALRQLRAAFRTFAYADGIFKEVELEVGGKQVATPVVDLDLNPGNDESAFLHALLTAPCRSVLWLAPAFVYRSPSISGSGVGKGLLAKAPSVIAFGEGPQTASLGKNEEFDKGLTALLLRGGHSILIDNLNALILRSDVLCSALSERPAFLRIMGLGKLAPVNSTALISITGCGLNVGRDLVRRTIVGDLDAKIEDPEQREFKAGFLDDIRARRIELLQYVFTILRWGRQNPDALTHGKALGSFDQWCSWVRDPLLTLGCPDPVARLAELKVKDPDRIDILGIFQKWWEHHEDDWTAAARLNDEVVQLLLHGRKFSRQRINSEVRQLIGTRIADYVLEEKKSETSKWAAAEFRLTATAHAPQTPTSVQTATSKADVAPTTPDAAAAPPQHASPPGSEPRISSRRIRELADWYCDQTHRRYNENTLDTAALDAELRAILREEVAFAEHVRIEFKRVMDVVFASNEATQAAAPPDAFNAEGRLAIWRDAFAKLRAETEPCPGWRPQEWARVHACIKQFLAGSRALTAARAGWSALDLFAVHKDVGVARHACVGVLVGNTTNGFVMRAEADGMLQFANGVKAPRRRLDADVCVPIWSFRAPATAPKKTGPE